MPGQGRMTVFTTYQWATRVTVAVVSTGAALLGASMFFGGAARFASPGFATARLVPGQHLTWGGGFLGAAGVTFVGIALGWRRRIVMSGIAAQAVGFAFLSVSLATTCLKDPRTAFTGVAAYFTLCAVAVVTWVAGYTLGSGHGPS